MQKHIISTDKAPQAIGQKNIGQTSLTLLQSAILIWGRWKTRA